ncbi:MAG: crotonase/enoyl-CoA hydratase family protein [SAR324 cluster bacterium]|nr:crotonase/enoyl-CoA hydratase family protein [SAR324 cluster bacterium]
MNIHIEQKVANIEISRPEKANAVNRLMWKEFKEAFAWVSETPEIRAAILSGAGEHFCSGIDLNDFRSMMKETDACEGRKRENLRKTILELQDSFNAIEKCGKPVIAAIHGGCIGAGVDMTSACDIRYCSKDAFFVIKEIDIGMTADVGTLQRLPHLIGDGIMRELAYTGRQVDADEAKKIGLVNGHYESKGFMMQKVTDLAQQIAAKSPLAIRGTKEMILYTRDHSVSEALNYVATWNAGMLLSQDILEIVAAQRENRAPDFED